MLSVLESADTQLHPRLAEEVAAMRAAGNMQAIPEADGFVYVHYAARGSCSFAQAQADPACRMFADAVYGAVVIMTGTTIHLSTIRVQVGGERTPNSNPFSKPECFDS
jgi:hypothetical protein